MELLLELIRPMGNAITRTIFPEGKVDQNSILSDAIRAVVLAVMLAAVIWLVVGHYTK